MNFSISKEYMDSLAWNVSNIREIQQINKELKNEIKELDFTIIQMKKELIERGIQKDAYLEKIKNLETEKKKDKLENRLEDMFRKW